MEKEKIEEQLLSEMRKAYKDGYLMAIKHLGETQTLTCKLSVEEIIKMLELSADSIQL